MFDLRWYLESYPDIAEAGVDAATHYLETGWLEGRDPGPEFSSTAYLRANPDVGRSGINPLLHFIEFGQFEGREIRGRRFPRWRKTTVVHDFGPAATVFRGSIGQQTGAPWRSWHRLSQDDERLFSIGDWNVAYVDSTTRPVLESAFEYLRNLSGYAADGATEAVHRIDESGSVSLTDAWFVNEATLRTRWLDAQFPFVVRAFQHDSSRDGEVALIADEIILSPLGILDLSVRDPFSPILLVFADPNGRARGVRLLAFPSLCRGGLHYPELLAASARDSALDPLALGRALAERLLIARRANDRCVKAISLDPTGADGTSPLMQPQFTGWLKRVAAMEIKASSAPEKAGALALACDMIPTIGILAGRAEKASGTVSFPGLLIAHPDPSEPALLVQLPSGAPPGLASGAPGYAAAWPCLSGSSPACAGQPGAIRLAASRELTDAELLMPTMSDPVPPASEQASITWLVEAIGSSGGEMADRAKALSMQPKVFTHVLAFIGKADPEAGKALVRLFDGGFRCCANVADAVRSAETDFIGYLGRGVVLHDPRTCSALASMLQDSAVASASCVLVDAEVHGKAWHVSIAQAGRTITEGRHCAANDVQQFWRSSYAVERPPRDLWLARTEAAREWFGRTPPTHLERGIHLCTSLVTASVSSQLRPDPIAVPPSAPRDRVTRIEALFG
ncbi:MAG TPA: hypothetical protein VFM42_05025 [Sphingomicrobium sp.]|nr:hypothetical protein [Sphingomicrobium sp.]